MCFRTSEVKHRYLISICTASFFPTNKQTEIFFINLFFWFVKIYLKIRNHLQSIFSSQFQNTSEFWLPSVFTGSVAEKVPIGTELCCMRPRSYLSFSEVLGVKISWLVVFKSMLSFTNGKACDSLICEKQKADNSTRNVKNSDANYNWKMFFRRNISSKKFPCHFK